MSAPRNSRALYMKQQMTQQGKEDTDWTWHSAAGWVSECHIMSMLLQHCIDLYFYPNALNPSEVKLTQFRNTNNLKKKKKRRKKRKRKKPFWKPPLFGKPMTAQWRCSKFTSGQSRLSHCCEIVAFLPASRLPFLPDPHLTLFTVTVISLCIT